MLRAGLILTEILAGIYPLNTNSRHALLIEFWLGGRDWMV